MVINPFENPCILHYYRDATDDEILAQISRGCGYQKKIKDRIKHRVDSPLQAAKAWVCGDNYDRAAIVDHIEQHLENNPNFKQAWMNGRLTRRRPPAIAAYQTEYEGHNVEQTSSLNSEIEQDGIILPVGQMLFHGANSLTWKFENPTIHPLATSFSPEVAYQNALHKGKHYQGNRIDLFCIEIKTPIPAFAFPIKGRSKLKHEMEVLLHSGIILTPISTDQIGTISCCDCWGKEVQVKQYLWKVDAFYTINKTHQDIIF